ncbi:hypothetical protein CFHF_17225 [Caulobacter flavus]|uniref:Iron dicitrate transport regulator FecR n=1 Tax=Caulobacter flavus TaxID=1679497 RepID=A0A2N5CQK2_9CAUL|nr:FecR domain-containing protein [Caulobacter flavus]AYV48729.1 hypothetical protein C1707_22060 [Caulobacter flavus]PLR10261.1 hypothetical protein CFHF_17225 [Caulobacter flavus]
MAEQDVARADAEALEWLLALHEEPESAELVARFEAWRVGHPGRARAWEEASGVYAVIGDVPPAHAERWASRPDGRGRAVGGARRPRRHAVQDPGRRRLVAALAASAAALVVAVLAPGAIVRLQSDYVTGVGEVRQVRLEDGSLVSLAPESALAVDYSAGQRDLRLVRGRAWFDVRHDPSRPFTVASREVDARVLGTAFEVDAESPGVTVQRGLVGVTSRRVKGMERVPAGQGVMLGRDGRFLRAPADPNAVAAWRHGQMLVENGTIGEVVRALGPWTRDIVLVRGQALSERRVTGVYNLRDPEAVTSALAQAYDLKVARVTPWILVISER